MDISTVYEDEYEDFINTELRDSHRELYKSYELITQTLLTTAALSLWVWRFLHHHQWKPCSVIRNMIHNITNYKHYWQSHSGH